MKRTLPLSPNDGGCASFCPCENGKSLGPPGSTRIENLAPLAKVGVKIFHLHGDAPVCKAGSQRIPVGRSGWIKSAGRAR